MPPPETPRKSRAWPYVRAVLALAGALLVQGIVAAAFYLAAPGTPIHLVIGAASAVACAFLLAWWFLVVREPLTTLGWLVPLPRALRGLFAGLAAGIGLMAVIVGVGLLASAWTLSPVDPSTIDWKALVLWTAVLVVAAHFEEVLLRGVVLQDLGRDSLLLGLILSSVAFAVLHVANPATEGRLVVVMLVLNIVLAGLLLSAAFLQTRDLWLATGLHVGWNWAQGILFGLPVSGIQMPSLLRGTMNADAPRVLAASFGPEASILSTLVVGGAAIAWLVVLRRRRARLPIHAAPSS